MELDYSCFTQKPNQDVVTFLKNASVRKITISQQSKVCEIFLLCYKHAFRIKVCFKCSTIRLNIVVEVIVSTYEVFTHTTI